MRIEESRGLAMRKETLAVSGVAAAALFVVALSCLPDLTLDRVGPWCGNGLIEYDAGEECESNGSTSGCTDACAMTCDGYKDDASFHCYYVVPQHARTIFAARGLCKKSNLVHFGSQDEHNAVLQNLKALRDTGGYAPFYVALQQATGTRITTRWEPLVAGVAGWSPTCPGCYQGVVTLDTDQPDAGDAGCACQNALQCASSMGRTQATPGGQIAPIGCVSERPLGVVCERNPSGNHTKLCPEVGGICITLASTHHKKSYVLTSQEVRPPEVDATCARIGATAVVFDTSLEREEIAEAVSELGDSAYKFWIGLSKTGGKWMWADGVAGDFGNRPSVFADRIEVFGASEGMRALITVTTGVPLVDNGLAHVQPQSVANEPPITVAPVLCQIP